MLCPELGLVSNALLSREKVSDLLTHDYTTDVSPMRRSAELNNSVGLRSLLKWAHAASTISRLVFVWALLSDNSSWGQCFFFFIFVYVPSERKSN